MILFRTSKGLQPVPPPGRRTGARPWAGPLCLLLAAGLLFSISAKGGAQLTGAPQAADKSATKAEYVGSETCAGCHEEVAKQFQSLPHASLTKDSKRGWKDRACEACHGPGSKHAESMSAADILQPAKLDPMRADKACLSCHANQKTQVGRVLGGHGRNQVSCTSCHTVHGKPEGEISFVGRRKQTLTAQCTKCHASVAAEFARPHHHRVPEGAMSCASCHNPHGAHAGRMDRASRSNEPGCLSCHTDKRGPFVYEHPVMRMEGCGACHEPHGSANPRMLTRQEVQHVCLECHSNLLSPNPQNGTVGGVFPALHDLRSPRFRNCTICHQKVHGSNVNRALLR